MNEDDGRHNARGFTLVELLVALAIFITVMSIVAFMFVTAVRTTKQGALNQEAFEMARGAMRLLERDLSRAFTNRDHGDVYSFYGTPIGFTYVGMVPSDDNTEYNLARVTWVIYHDLAETTAGAVSLYETTSGQSVPTYALLRYVEPGVDNLDAFPVPWNSVADIDSGLITLESIAEQTRDSVDCPDSACEEIAMSTGRRDVWLRMLAGGDGQVDSAWNRFDMFADLDPSDYFVTENIRYLQVIDVPCSDTESNLDVSLADVEPPNFMFGGTFFAQNNFPNTFCSRVYGDVNAAPLLNSEFLDFLNPNFTQDALPKPNLGPQPFFTYWDLGVIQNNILTDVDDQVTPLAFTFWNDTRNMIGDGVDNDGDGRIDVGADQSFGGSDNDWDEIYGSNLGSPLNARLPLAVTTDFTLFFRSPYPGAPDFNQRFTQRIDLPTGYRRTVTTSAGAP